MAKHSQPFVEVVTRLYMPLYDLKDLQGINLDDLLKHGTVQVHQPQAKHKGGQRDQGNV